MVSKKTSRSPKSASPAQPPEQTKKTPSPAASAPKAAAPKAAGRATKKTAPANPARRVVTRRKPLAEGTPSAPEAVQPATVVSDEDIRIRAYFLSLEYQGSGRDDVDFWLLAELELRPKTTPGDR